MTHNHWHDFVQTHKGQGLSMTQLSAMYHQTGGRFMCCSTFQEEQLVRDYIKTHQRYLIDILSPLGIYKVTVDKSRNRDGGLGRFIISFRDENNTDLCHLTLVCEENHWSQSSELRKPHFTINNQYYFYIFDTATNTLNYRSGQHRTRVPAEIIYVTEQMLAEISSDACPPK